MAINSGIYCITNQINQKSYIGSTISFNNRFGVHKYMLNKNCHHSPYLQHAVNKYGLDNFKFSILATCPSEYRIKLEQWFIDNLKPEYNIQKVAGVTTPKWTDERKAQYSQRMTGKLLSDYHLQRLKDAAKRRIKLKEPKPDKAIRFVCKVCPTTLTLIEQYSSGKDASKQNGIIYSSLMSSVHNKTFTVGGFHWCYDCNLKDAADNKLKFTRSFNKVVMVNKQNNSFCVVDSQTECARNLSVNNSTLGNYLKAKQMFETTEYIVYPYNYLLLLIFSFLII